MTELGEQLILALASQGFALVFDDEDMIVLSSDRRTRIHVPAILLDDPALELLLMVVIERFVVEEGLQWTSPDGTDPSTN